MEFRILGPVEVADGGRTVEVGGHKQRALLALLLLHANEVVSTDRLVEELWGDELPANAAKSLQIHVSRLRKALGDGALETAPHGYLVRVQPGEFDLDRFRTLAEAGRKALAADDLSRAAELLEEALSLWRGPPLADLSFEGFAQAEIARLEELRLAAVEARIDADLGLGCHVEVVSELEALAAAHPLRESLTGRLMLALYRSGRQAEALRAYQETRRRLAEGLGLEPSEPLRALERAILNQDGALSAPARPRSPLVPPRVQRRAGTIALAGALMLAAAAAAVVLATRSDGSPGPSARVVVAPNSLAVIDPKTNRLVADVPVGNGPTLVAAGAGALWVANGQDQTVSRVDPQARVVAKIIGIAFAPEALTADEGGVWFATGADSNLAVSDGLVARIDPRTNQPGQIIRSVGGGGGRAVLALGGGSLWIGNDDDPRIYRLDPGSNAISLAVSDVTPRSLTFGAGSLWALRPVDRSVVRIDPDAYRVIATVPFEARGAGATAFGAGALWVADTLEGVVWRIDPAANVASGTIEVGQHPGAVVVAGGFVWVANTGAGTVSKIDPRTNEVVAVITVGHVPAGIAAADGEIWVLVRKCVLAC